MRLIAAVAAVAALLAAVLTACGSSSDVDVEKADDSACRRFVGFGIRG